jgi:hypothetical protein
MAMAAALERSGTERDEFIGWLKAAEPDARRRRPSASV